MSGTERAAATGWEAARDAAVGLIEMRDFDGAIALLAAGPADDDPDGERDALLGLAEFHAERYDEAAGHYASALDARTDPEWGQMHAACAANAAGQVNIEVPAVRYFDRDELLATPPVPSIPGQPRRRLSLGIWRRFRYLVGHAVGAIAGAVFEMLISSFGKNYRGEVWTNWYRKRLYSGILTLAYMREKLNSNNLHTTYPAGHKVGFQPDGLTPPDGVTHSRTADGSWNNLDDPKEGAAGTRFARNVANSAIKPADDEDLLSPNPRLVSRALLTRGETMKEVPFLNLLAASWIQFQNHDWITHGENLATDIIEIPLAEDDPARARYHQRNMFVGRTQPDPTRQDSDSETPVTFINEVTHWWDGSQLYGSDQATQDRLRSGHDGKLRVDDDGTLPLDSKGVEETGFTRNWWVGLAMLHNLFVLEHNAICDHLKEHHRDWDDDRLFNVARLVNAAVMAKIHSIEWTPAILPNHRLDLGLNSNWYGMLTYKFRKPDDRKAVAEFNVSNPELGGLVGNKLNKHDSPFALSEEFVEVYRLHSLLPETLIVRDSTTGEITEEVPFVASRQAGSPELTERAGMGNMFYSFGNQQPGALELNNYPRFMQELSIPGNPVFDLGAVDILRARERGVPRYNAFRRELGLNPIRSFDDLTDDAEVIAQLEEVYGNDIEQLDLMIGTLAEQAPDRRPTNFGFGETMFQIFILNASRRLQADRFYTDDYREEVYSAEGMAWVDDSSLKKVILRHLPELAATGLGNVKNAFEPWDTAPELDLDRHPLRAYDPDLQPHPERGDAATDSDAER